MGIFYVCALFLCFYAFLWLSYLYFIGMLLNFFTFMPRPYIYVNRVQR